jgi:hypothetical protein
LNFPAVQRLVGEDFFAAAADTFITREPPQTAWLDLYGEGFPEFLDGFEPAAALIYLPDVARLERAVGQALHAPDAKSLEHSRLLDIEPSYQGRVCFTPHPSVSLVSSSYPVDEIWRAVLARDDATLAAIDLSTGAVRLCPSGTAFSTLTRDGMRQGMSAFGTKRTSQSAPLMSAIGGKADIGFCPSLI